MNGCGVDVHLDFLSDTRSVVANISTTYSKKYCSKKQPRAWKHTTSGDLHEAQSDSELGKKEDCDNDTSS